MTPEFDQKTRDLHDALDRYAKRVKSSNRGAVFFIIAFPLAFIFSFIIGISAFM